ncbi:GumC family protein, partial [Petrachloros mirabilis]
MSPRDFLRIVFKRKIQILVVLVVSVGIVGIASFSATPTYEATAQLLVKIGMEAVYAPILPMGDSTPIVRMTRQEQINSEIEILKSRFLAEKVMESLGPEGLYKDSNNTSKGGFLGSLFHSVGTTQSPDQNAVSSTQTGTDKLQQNTVVEPVKDSNVINIRFKHDDPQLAAKVVNTLVKLYLDRHLQVHKNPQSSAFFGKQSQILEDELKQAEENLNKFKKEHDLISLEEERSLLLTQEADLRTAVNRTLSEEAEMENRLRNPVPDTKLHERLVELELKEHELLTKYTD